MPIVSPFQPPNQSKLLNSNAPLHECYLILNVWRGAAIWLTVISSILKIVQYEATIFIYIIYTKLIKNELFQERLLKLRTERNLLIFILQLSMLVLKTHVDFTVYKLYLVLNISTSFPNPVSFLVTTSISVWQKRES